MNAPLGSGGGNLVSVSHLTYLLWPPLLFLYLIPGAIYHPIRANSKQSTRDTKGHSPAPARQIDKSGKQGNFLLRRYRPSLSTRIDGFLQLHWMKWPSTRGNRKRLMTGEFGNKRQCPPDIQGLQDVRSASDYWQETRKGGIVMHQNLRGWSLFVFAGIIVKLLLSCKPC